MCRSLPSYRWSGGSCGKKERGKRESVLCACAKKKRRSERCAQTIRSSSPFLQHRFPHQTLHSTPETHSPATRRVLCKVNFNAITNHSTHLVESRAEHPPPHKRVLGSRTKAQLSFDLMRANKPRLRPVHQQQNFSSPCSTQLREMH